MTTFNTGAYPPGCTQRHVDEASPGYWDDDQEWIEWCPSCQTMITCTEETSHCPNCQADLEEQSS